MTLDKNNHRKGNDRRSLIDRRTGFDRRREARYQPHIMDMIYTTAEACNYLRISRPTYLKNIAEGKINAKKIGRGWKVYKSELVRLMRTK